MCSDRLGGGAMPTERRRLQVAPELGSNVVLFPLASRQKHVNRLARTVAFRGYELGSHDPAATGEKILAHSIRMQRQGMERRGIDPETIERELQQFEAAVRARALALRAESGPA